MERISGPFNGFYIATRAAPSRQPDSGFLALSKICRGKPQGFLDAYCCATVDAAHAFDTEEEAMADAERRALARTAELAPFTFARPGRIRHYAEAG